MEPEPQGGVCMCVCCGVGEGGVGPWQRSRMGEVAPAGRLPLLGDRPQELQRQMLGCAKSWLCHGAGEDLEGGEQSLGEVTSRRGAKISFWEGKEVS